MEPVTIHEITLPQPNLTRSAGDGLSGPRPDDSLMPGGHENPNSHDGQQVASMSSEAMDSTEVGAFHLEEAANAEVLENETSQKVLTRLDVFNLFKYKFKDLSLSLSEQVNTIFEYFGESYHISHTKEEFAPVLAKFLSKSKNMYKKCNYSMKYFEKKHQDWLSQIMITGQLIAEDSTLTPKSKTFANLSMRQQLKSRRRLQTQLQDEPLIKKVKSFTASLSIEGVSIQSKPAKDLEKVIYTCIETPEAPTNIYKKITNCPQPYTPEEALSVVIDRKLTVETYNFLHMDHQDRGFPAFPSYYKVLAAKKDCYPSNITISEREAKVPFQDLLQHTFDRLLRISDEVVIQYCETKSVKELECVLEGNWGFDGSTGQSLYKQAFSDAEGGEENSLIATTFIPLVVRTNNVILWKNPAPQSYRYCRPVCVQYRKETAAIIMSEKSKGEDAISNLSPLLGETTKGHKINTSCLLSLAAIDGKVLNTILHTSSQMRCPYCSLTATQFNNIDLALQQPINIDALKHGVSPLHAWIRVLEFLLHLSYKKVVKKWRIPKKSEEKGLVDARKKAVQQQMREKLGLLVDVVRPNSGTTNDGNTARIALSDKNRQILSEILDLEQWLLDDLHVILTVMSSGLPIDGIKFGDFCKQIAFKYVENYEWHPMTVTIHKILVHGAAIINSTSLSIGMLSEQASESRNKFWRSDREHHCRKMDRVKTMTDLFHRALESSDPVISHAHLRQRQKKQCKIPLSAVAITMLKPLPDPNMMEEHTSADEIESYDAEEYVVLCNEEDIESEV